PVIARLKGLRSPRHRGLTPTSECQAEAHLRRTVLRIDMPQVLRRRALLGADGPVRPVEDVEDFCDAIDRHAAVQRDPLLYPHARGVLRWRDDRIARYDRPVRAQPAAEGGTRVPQVAAVVARLPNAGTQVMETTQLEAVPHLPDPTEDRPVALIVLGQPP